MASYRLESRVYCGQVRTHDFEAPNDQTALSVVCEILGTRRPLPYIKAEFYGLARIICLLEKGQREVQFDEVEPVQDFDFSRLSRKEKDSLYIVLT